MEDDREELERRIADANRSMSSRLALLGGRVERARRLMSIRQHVAERPWLVLGAAAGAGLWLGRSHGRASSARTGGQRPAPGLLATVAARLVHSVISIVASSVAASIVAEFSDSGEKRMRAEEPRDPDSDTRTTGVRIYPIPG